jgi:hypothetical protein
MLHNFSLSTAQNEMLVPGAVFVSGLFIHSADASKLDATVRITQRTTDDTHVAPSRPAEQTLVLSGTVNALPSCEHVRLAAKLSHSSPTPLTHTDELSVALLAIDVDGLPIESTGVRFIVRVWYEGNATPAIDIVDVVRNAINGSMYSARVRHSRAGKLHITVVVHDAWDASNRSRVPECQSLDKQIDVRCALQYKQDPLTDECVPFDDEGTICSRSTVVVGSTLYRAPLTALPSIEVRSRIEVQLDPKDQNVSNQYNISLTPTECSETSPLSSGVILNRPGKQKLQVSRGALDICTLVSEVQVACRTGEAEIEGRCISRQSCDVNTQLEIDGRCVDPEAAGTFALDELRVNVFKPANGVDGLRKARLLPFGHCHAGRRVRRGVLAARRRARRALGTFGLVVHEAAGLASGAAARIDEIVARGPRLGLAAGLQARRLCAQRGDGGMVLQCTVSDRAVPAARESRTLLT